MSVHDLNDVAVVTGSFYNASGDLADPTALVFTFRKPDGTTTEYTHGTDVELVKQSTGVFAVNVTLDAAGGWFWSWRATGVVTDSDHGYFYVRAAWSKILTADELVLHLETDLTSSELDHVIAAESAFIDEIVGPATSDVQFFRHVYAPDAAERYYSDQRYQNPSELTLRRPALSITSVVERDEDEVSTTLASDDYRLITPFVIERRDDGTNPRIDWGPEVTITFIPLGDLSGRRQALIELCKLTVASNGYSRIQDNEIQVHPLHRTVERVYIVAQLHKGVPFV